MRENKIAIWATSLLMVLSLVGGVAANCSGNNLLANLLIGLFSSGSVALIIAIINYCLEKKECLERFFHTAWDMARILNKYPFYDNFQEKVLSTLNIGEASLYELNICYYNLSFLCGHKRKRKALFKVCDVINKYFTTIHELSQRLRLCLNRNQTEDALKK